jgi:diguanylate cyclase (GGDEF)-like protein
MDNLRGAGIFAGEDDAVLEWVGDQVVWRNLAGGDCLIEQNQLYDRFYILTEGRLEVRLRRQEEVSVAVLGPGDCVGEMSIIDNGRASASVTALQDCRLLVIPAETLWMLVDKSNVFARNLLYIFSSRIRQNHTLLTDVTSQTRLYERYSKLDALTGLFNRRWLDEMLPRHIERAERAGEPLCLMVVDIDNFKPYNDRYSHMAGDCIIAHVAHIIGTHIRPRDSAVRFGGDEFLLLLPNTGRATGLEVAERLRLLVRERPQGCVADLPESLSLSVSIGVAASDSGIPCRQLMEQADQALYRSKQGGRNRVS